MDLTSLGAQLKREGFVRSVESGFHSVESGEASVQSSLELAGEMYEFVQ
jgi:hypothetical protein